MNIMLKATNIKKNYGNKQMTCNVLKGINFEVNEGQFLGVMGPSGSGKTTLLNILSTIDKPTEGQVILNNIDLSKIKEKHIAKFRRDNIGFVFQNFNLIDNMTIEDNIALPLVLNGSSLVEINSQLYEITKQLGVFDQLKKYPYELSGGQKQKVATARALISSPKVLFADEPTGALDSKSSKDLLSFFKTLHQKFGTTIVMVTHDAYVASFCDKIVFLKDGKIYTDIHKTNDQQTYYENILNVLSVIGGT